MPYRPRELVVRAREAAMLLLSALDRDEMVQRFLDIYAAENRRPGRADQPAHYREQLETIRREAILAMVLRVERALPARLKVRVSMRTVSRRKKASKKKKRGSARMKRRSKPAVELAIPFLDLFREEFFVALGQALRWSDEDAQEFWRDLEVYEKLSGHEPQRASGRSARGIVSGPFVDRTALLLDPSLMEQARWAAGKFQLELNSAADRVLRKIFSRRTGR
ncbi:MAG TPA: hypothetical protein VEU52_08960 [Candidatus Limnocylindrales bacterium]|nr:hypothetical protein [Candidatus Limnocylindrales bacterium]